MENKNNQIDSNIPKSTLQTIKKAQESYKRLAENVNNIIPKLPKIDISKYQLPKLHDITMSPNTDVIREQNVWERHKEMLDIENSVLGILTKIIEEQKSTTTLTRWILFLSIIVIFFTILFNLLYYI